MKKPRGGAFIRSVKKIAVVENRFEADLVKDALEKEGIPCVIRSYEDTAYDGLYVMQKGWGAILVSAEDEGRARAVIQELFRSWGR